MPVYTGYSSTNLYQRRNTQSVGVGGGTGSFTQPYRQSKKYTLTDTQLVIQDIVNALNIPAGSLPGNPTYGTTIWGYVFEPNDATNSADIEDEVRRVIGLEPRINLNTVTVATQENGVSIDVELSIAPFNQAVQTAFFLNKTNGQATQV